MPFFNLRMLSREPTIKKILDECVLPSHYFLGILETDSSMANAVDVQVSTVCNFLLEQCYPSPANLGTRLNENAENLAVL
jgi:hypothetical protein